MGADAAPHCGPAMHRGPRRPAGLEGEGKEAASPHSLVHGAAAGAPQALPPFPPDLVEQHHERRDAKHAEDNGRCPQKRKHIKQEGSRHRCKPLQACAVGCGAGVVARRPRQAIRPAAGSCRQEPSHRQRSRSSEAGGGVRHDMLAHASSGPAPHTCRLHGDGLLSSVQGLRGHWWPPSWLVGSNASPQAWRRILPHSVLECVPHRCRWAPRRGTPRAGARPCPGLRPG